MGAAPSGTRQRQARGSATQPASALQARCLGSGLAAESVMEHGPALGLCLCQALQAFPVPAGLPLWPLSPRSATVYKVMFRGEVVAAKEVDLGRSPAVQQLFVQVGWDAGGRGGRVRCVAARPRRSGGGRGGACRARHVLSTRALAANKGPPQPPSYCQAHFVLHLGFTSLGAPFPVPCAGGRAAAPATACARGHAL